MVTEKLDSSGGHQACVQWLHVDGWGRDRRLGLVGARLKLVWMDIEIAERFFFPVWSLPRARRQSLPCLGLGGSGIKNVEKKGRLQ